MGVALELSREPERARRDTGRDAERLALASVLQELTVAALELFDPGRSADPFLDRVAERLGCYAALLVSAEPGAGHASLVGASGIGSASRALPLSASTAEQLLATDRELTLPYSELARSDLVCLRFAIASPPEHAQVCLVLYLHVTTVLPAQYRGMVQRLARILSTVLTHRELFARTMASERRLDQERTLLERVGDASNVGTLVLAGSRAGPEGAPQIEIVFTNRRFVEMWGLDPARDLRSGSDLLAAMGARVRDPVSLTVRGCTSEDGGDEDVHDELVLRDGRVLDRRCAPVRSAAGIDYGRGFYFRDVTARKAVEADREQHLETERAARAAAEAAIRARDEFLSVASHELRTPLTSMQLVVQALRDAYERGAPVSPKTALDLLGSVERQTRRLSRLVGEMLDASRIEAGWLSLEREPFDLVALCEDVIARFGRELTRSRSTVELHADGPVIGLWDRSRVDQIATNLLSNAVQYGAGRPIDVCVRAENGSALLEVRDRGLGIAPERVGRVFQRFERAVSARHYGGLGLGLYVVRQIVEMHGGTVTVATQPGLGSTFTVRLPLRPPA